MLSKYDILVNTLDSICKTAPDEFSSYNISEKNTEKLNAIRSQAYIHLYLLVKFGVQDFRERHSLITDGADDGGIDAYYIDKHKRVIYIIQSKFRTNENNFENKEIEPIEIVKMEIKDILDGKDKGSNGKSYNGKIKGFQRKLTEIENIGLYDYKIVLLANLYSKNNIRIIETLFQGFKYQVMDYNLAYDELVFPLCSSTYFQNDTIIIDKDIKGITNTYSIQFKNTSYGKCSVMLMFVPLIFIAEIVDKYKNSILQLNPRNYLSMSNNSVNQSIMASLQDDNQDFALLNNGITMLCSSFTCTSNNGLEDSTRVHIEDPQIINGGQTAVTLSKALNSTSLLESKKVLLKVIATFKEDKERLIEEQKREERLKAYTRFINSISDATNKQTRISEDDRRSNLSIQRELQVKIYQKYGLFYERKSGEFEEALKCKIIPTDQILKRDKFLRALTAINGNCGEAMSSSKDTLFELNSFIKTINESTRIELAVYAYLIYQKANKLGLNNKHKKPSNWGNGTRYGKYALVYATGIMTADFVSEENSLKELHSIAENSLMTILNQWSEFEEFAQKKPSNNVYFGAENSFSNYYKSGNVNNDIKEFWEDKKSRI